MLTFRRARSDDLGSIIAMLVDDILGKTRETPDRELPPEYAAAFRRIDADPDHEMVVGELDGEVVSYCLLSIVPGLSQRGRLKAIVEEVRVAGDRRGCGIGARMMKHVEHLALLRGAKVLQLTSDRRRPDAHRFYERIGFQPSHVGMKKQLSPVPVETVGAT